MNKKILKISAVLGLGVCLAAGCQDKEAELLIPKLYFENEENVIDLEEGVSTMDYELQSRLSSMTSSDVQVTYTLETDADILAAYNQKFGKEYPLFPGATLGAESSVIHSGEIYSDAVMLNLPGLDAVAEGASYVLPVRVNTGDVPMIEGSDLTYIVIRRLPKITRVAQFNNNYFKIPISPLNVFTEVTYEALVNISSFGNNNTIMGCEGVMIMRVGDAGGGTVPKDVLQMAGKAEMTYSDGPLTEGKWYHLAFTCNSANEGHLYVNGEEVIEGTFAMSSDLTAGGADFGFSVGMVPGFEWGTRPLNGYMSEVRLWNVVRSANQIKDNMLTVDPASPGLLAYYKLNGELKDATENHLDPTDLSMPKFVDLENPVAVGGDL